MVTSPVRALCALCEQPATVMDAPARRTFDRGLDPSDESFSLTVMLPDVPLCDAHVAEVHSGDRIVGWCDQESCRAYGEAGETSACGERYVPLGPKARSRSGRPKAQ